MCIRDSQQRPLSLPGVEITPFRQQIRENVPQIQETGDGGTCLCDHGRGSRAGDTHMKDGDKHTVQHDVQMCIRDRDSTNAMNGSSKPRNFYRELPDGVRQRKEAAELVREQPVERSVFEYPSRQSRSSAVTGR